MEGGLFHFKKFGMVRVNSIFCFKASLISWNVSVFDRKASKTITGQISFRREKKNKDSTGN